MRLHRLIPSADRTIITIQVSAIHSRPLHALTDFLPIIGHVGRCKPEQRGRAGDQGAWENHDIETIPRDCQECGDLDFPQNKKKSSTKLKHSGLILVV